MMPAGNPPHVHSYTDADGTKPQITPTFSWQEMDPIQNPHIYNEINEPVYVNFMWLFANNKLLSTQFDLALKSPSGTQVEAVSFVDEQQKKLKSFFKAQEFAFDIPSFYREGTIISGINMTRTNGGKSLFDNSFKLRRPDYAPKIKMSFNWYEKCYAEAAAKVPESLLPNLHLLTLNIEDPERFMFSHVDHFDYTLVYGNIFSMGNSPYFHPPMDPALEPYFNAWLHSVNDSHTPTQENITKTLKQAFPSLKYLNKYTSQEHVFPWAAELGFYTNPIQEDSLVARIKNPKTGVKPFDELGQQTGHKLEFSEYLTQWFMRWAIDYIHSSGKTVDPNGDFLPEGDVLDIAKKDAFYIKKSEATSLKKLPTWYLDNLLMPGVNKIFELASSITTEELENIAYSLDIKNGLVIDPPPGNQDTQMMEGYNVNETILAMVLITMLTSLKLNNPSLGHGPRCIADLLNGDLAYAEPVFYGIEKKRWLEMDEQISVPAGEFFIAAPFENNFINFIDTQLKYDKSYTYEAYAYVLVVGNDYKYNSVKDLPLAYDQFKSTLGNWATQIDVEPFGEKPIGLITAINRPTIRLVKVPYTSFATIHVADAPPTEPFVEISPYKNVNNKLLFWLSETVGNYDAKPILIRAEDKELFLKAYRSASVEKFAETLPDTIHFSADSKVTKYQIFRIDKHPNSYSDFAKGFRELPEGDDSFVDNIIPNKKYYYLFRSVDHNGYVSNPTYIYQVEMIHDGGASYPIIKTVDLVPFFPKTKETSGRKYVHIVPTFKQSVLKVDKNATTAHGANPEFGSIFGTESRPTKFKIRFTSKSSCRKFDLNVNFIHDHDVNPSPYLKWIQAIAGAKPCYEYENIPTRPQENKEGVAAPSEVPTLPIKEILKRWTDKEVDKCVVKIPTSAAASSTGVRAPFDPSGVKSKGDPGRQDTETKERPKDEGAKYIADVKSKDDPGMQYTYTKARPKDEGAPPGAYVKPKE